MADTFMAQMNVKPLYFLKYFIAVTKYLTKKEKEM